MGLETTVKPETIEKNKNGLVYSISHGSGGFKATYEAVRVFYEPSHNEPFKMKFTNPGGSSDIGRYNTIETVIRSAQDEARKRLKRTVTRNHKPTKKPHSSYPEGVPQELQKFV